MAQLEVLNPVAESAVSRSVLARRLAALDGKKIALYWNAKPGGDLALKHVKERVESRFKGTEFEFIRSGIPGPKEAVEKAKTFDAAIGSTGD